MYTLHAANTKIKLATKQFEVNKHRKLVVWQYDNTFS